MSHDKTCQSHCCVLHGCKYSAPDCPVVNRRLVQDYPCEYCESIFLDPEEIPNPDDPDYDLFDMSDRDLLAEARRLRRELREKAMIPVMGLRLDVLSSVTAVNAVRELIYNRLDIKDDPEEKICFLIEMMNQEIRRGVRLGMFLGAARMPQKEEQDDQSTR